MKRVNVSVVLFRNPIEQLEALFESLLSSEDINRIICIDHSPTSELKSFIDRAGLTYVSRPDNPGYGAGHNVGIRISFYDEIDYHLVVNPDVVMHENSLNVLVRHLDRDSNLALCVPRITDLNGDLEKSCKLLPTPIDLIRRLPIINKFFSENTVYDLGFSDYKKTMWAPFYSGSCMLFRVSGLKEVGLFDEKYFMYAEDIDISRRVAAKYESLFIPDASITHVHAAESKKKFKFLLVHAWNIIRYFNKWGWFIDKERKDLNSACLKQFNSR